MLSGGFSFRLSKLVDSYFERVICQGIRETSSVNPANNVIAKAMLPFKQTAQEYEGMLTEVPF